jgi:hypothetical protein
LRIKADARARLKGEERAGIDETGDVRGKVERRSQAVANSVASATVCPRAERTNEVGGSRRQGSNFDSCVRPNDQGVFAFVIQRHLSRLALPGIHAPYRERRHAGTTNLDGGVKQEAKARKLVDRYVGEGARSKRTGLRSVIG